MEESVKVTTLEHTQAPAYEALNLNSNSEERWCMLAAQRQSHTRSSQRSKEAKAYVIMPYIHAIMLYFSAELSLLNFMLEDCDNSGSPGVSVLC